MEINDYLKRMWQFIRRMTKTPKSETAAELITELHKELNPFAKHLFNASWQWRQYDMVWKDIPANWVVFCMDYAENCACKSQDEVQAMIHPVVASYRCTENGCDSIVTDSIIFVSNDFKHCYHGVQHFNALAIKRLQEKGVQIDLVV